MPRYYRRRYTRVVRPKKKWASNITVWNAAALGNNFAATLVSNSSQSSSPTPTILKVGNFKISADLMFSTSNAINNMSPGCIGYILYLPEGWGTTAAQIDDLITKHPEWIMATKTMGGNMVSGQSQVWGVDSLNMSTRLKRNLNSGDSIIFYIKFNISSSNTVNSATVTGNCRWWTCAN